MKKLKKGFLLIAFNNNEMLFEAGGNTYIQETVDEDYAIIKKLEEVGLATIIGKDVNVSMVDNTLGDDFNELALTVVKNQEATFEYNGFSYYGIHNKKNSIF